MRADLLLVRDFFTEDTTLGKLYINGRYFCETLEDVDRDFNRDGDNLDSGEQKIHANTAIPIGEDYNVELTFSSAFKRILPIIYNQSDRYTLSNKGLTFAGVRLHGGNTHIDTKGCPLVAYKRYIKTPNPIKRTILNWIQGSAEKDLVKLLEDYSEIKLSIRRK